MSDGREAPRVVAMAAAGLEGRLGGPLDRLPRPLDILQRGVW
jgi:hypothetical protein